MVDCSIEVQEATRLLPTALVKLEARRERLVHVLEFLDREARATPTRRPKNLQRRDRRQYPSARRSRDGRRRQGFSPSFGSWMARADATN